jgi:pyruvate, orthophosphate dikinase
MRVTNKFVYTFGNGEGEGSAAMRDLLGGKGANLSEMSRLGIPVPPGFTITTECCNIYYENKKTFPESVQKEVQAALRNMESILGVSFGNTKDPLLVSVRSGARVSMPGMMDTVLNLGLNDETVLGLAKRSGDERFAFDSYRRFIQMYSNVVLGLPGELFEEAIDVAKSEKGVSLDTDLSVASLKALVKNYKKIIAENCSQSFPQDPQEQLWGSINAVFSSWNNKRAIDYRKINGIPDHWGTAVNVQAMVFGNMGEDCGTGVAFTRDPATGEHFFFGEYLPNAQGEDVVAGIRTPRPLSKKKTGDDHPMEDVFPEAYQTLNKIQASLEKHYRDMQDIEFTIQQGKVWMLQTRGGKRTAQAAVKIAVDMFHEGLISKKEALERVTPTQIDQLLHPRLDPQAAKTVITKGLPASPGAAVGQVVFSADDAELKSQKGHKVILVRLETSPEDIHGMHAAEGVLTARGGMTSHAAVVARGMGKCCVSGAGKLQIYPKEKYFQINGNVVHEGDEITLDGSTGEVMLGKVPTIHPELSGDFGTLMDWADEVRSLKIRTNADTPSDCKTARQFGAEGIGLCRTEHMFFEPERIHAVRRMIVADNAANREKALAELLPFQKSDFKEIFSVMEGLPVTIRLLDPPLHEFLPHADHEIEGLAKSLHISVGQLRQTLSALSEMNPMLGHRGCRLGVTYPEIYRMQVRALMEAACELVKEKSISVIPEIMIPLVGLDEELSMLRNEVDVVCKAVIQELGTSVPYSIGTMIELPRAALTADKIAEHAEFFSFGTNDLTQMAMGLSRDDAGKFLPTYIEKGILHDDPFMSLDQAGVGQLVQIGVEKGRRTNPQLKVGVCGEHGGEEKSIAFFHKAGLNYVSCSPYRVPAARLAAAQAKLGVKGGG